MSEKPLPACCPLCDNAIMEYEPAGLYFHEEAKCLAHEFCLEEITQAGDQ